MVLCKFACIVPDEDIFIMNQYPQPERSGRTSSELDTIQRAHLEARAELIDFYYDGADENHGIPAELTPAAEYAIQLLRKSRKALRSVDDAEAAVLDDVVMTEQTSQWTPQNTEQMYLACELVNAASFLAVSDVALSYRLDGKSYNKFGIPIIV